MSMSLGSAEVRPDALPRVQTDYEADLARIERELSDTGPDPLGAPVVDYERLMMYVHRLFARSSLTGRWSDSERASLAIDRAMSLVDDRSDLHYLQAQLSLRWHRLDVASEHLSQSRTLRESPFGQGIRAEIDFHTGRYTEAERGLRDLIERDRTWDSLARLAHLHAKMGKLAEADALYLEAEDELTAKQMRSYAWLQLQRGVLALQRGQRDDAWDFYRRAERAYSGYWMVDEHVAEVLAHAGKFAQAAALYEDVIARTGKPEFEQVLGDLYSVAGERERAHACYVNALATYLDSVRAGHVHYYHHLVDLYVDGLPDTGQAVHWAREDVKLRDNCATQSALAWALLAHGQVQEALHWMERPLRAGFRDAHTLRTAARVFEAAGRSEEARRLADEAQRLNPLVGSFHVHR